MNWKVYKSKVEVFPHYNAEKLDIVKAGSYQFVTQKGLYNTGDDAFVVPEKSILPDSLKENWINYLKGNDKNRVGSVTLRGEVSQGILISSELAKTILGNVYDSIPYDEDIANKLGISKYEPPIPVHMMGDLEKLPFDIHYFDCIQYGIHAEDFSDEDEIVVTEKIHGSQLNYCLTPDNKEYVFSKGLGQRGICIKEDIKNIYWNAIRNDGVKEKVIEIYKTIDCVGIKYIQLTGEVIPCQKGYNYGASKPTVLFFNTSLVYNNKPKVHIQFPTIPAPLNHPPIIACGKYGELKDKLRDLAKGMETYSGKVLHIKEGIVVRCNPDKRAHDGDYLRTKILNPKYVGLDDDIS